jgi:hypothetical protein
VDGFERHLLRRQNQLSGSDGREDLEGKDNVRVSGLVAGRMVLLFSEMGNKLEGRFGKRELYLVSSAAFALLRYSSTKLRHLGIWI